MTIASFTISLLPKIEFGPGCFNKLPELLAQYGQKILLVTGKQSIESSDHWQLLQGWLKQSGHQVARVKIDTEPSPQMIDDIVTEYRHSKIDIILGLGGGSVLDAAKAVSGLLRLNHSVMDFLEGVGPELTYPGPAVPFIAIPTTAGTGSEATKNAVLSDQNYNGFKKSFRDDQLIPQYAIIDPDLLKSCPDELIAANGMDALTQLLESFVSTRSNTMTDALAISGLNACTNSLLEWYQHGPDESDARANMAYASLTSGICLAQTGLGSVHGLAAPLGAFFPIPHGVACGTLVATATRVNIESMQSRAQDNPALAKYEKIARVLCNKDFNSRQHAFDGLITTLEDLTENLHLPRLGKYGVTKKDVEHITKHSRGSSMKTNPIDLNDNEISRIVSDRI